MKVEKYVALGNDFLITSYNINADYKEKAKKLCSRRLGIGSDGLIVVNEKHHQVDFYNADGSYASMCGNGIRCAFYYLYRRNKQEEMILKVNNVSYKLKLISLKSFIVDVEFPKDIIEITNMNLSNSINAYSVFVGNSHLVIIDKEEEKILSLMNKNKDELLKTNIDIVRKVKNNVIKVDTFERGVGKTLSCGTGALASVIAYKRNNILFDDIIVENEIGKLLVKEDDTSYHLRGEVEFLAEIEAHL